MTLAAIINAEVAGDSAIELTDAQIQDVFRLEAKKRSEAADIYMQAGRTEAEAAERAELAVLERYLPAVISDTELELIVTQEVEIASAQGLTGPKAMGSIVKAVRARAGAGADGAKIAELVKTKLV